MKTTRWLALLFFPLLLSAQTAELFFSEYIEGSSYNKALEIYNGTGAAIDLNAGKYAVQMFMNGNISAGLTVNLTGTVTNGDVFVLAHSSAAAVILDQADQTAGGSWYNGNDAVALVKNGVIIDVIGQIGVDPGDEWGSGLTGTKDNTLRRKSPVCAGDANGGDAFDPALEWDGLAVDTFDGLGNHTADCGSGPSYTPIYDIQHTIAPGGDSPLKDQSGIITEGVVTAVFSGGYIIQDGAGAWRGLWIADAAHAPVRGDRLRLTGTVRETGGLTTLAELSGYQLLSSGNGLPAAQVLTTGEVAQEQWEGVLVRVENVTVVNADLGDGEWSVSDGSGELRIDDKGGYSYTPTKDAALAAVLGVLDFSAIYKLQPRDDDDIVPPLERQVVINEIHADPDAVHGDANQDGAVSTTQDEFVELLNLGSADVDLSSWTISDKNSVRHTFPAGTVLKPKGCALVFGGGAPAGDFGGAIVQTASSGALSLNNDDETITLHDGTTAIEVVTYGKEGGDNQSLTRDPDGTGAFVKHSQAARSNGALFSPGRRLDGSSFFSTYLHQIQGSGAVSPFDGASGVTIEGVVVGDFQGTDELSGFFLQEEDHQVDDDPATSEGLFVYHRNTDVSVGERVRVTGKVSEYYEKTQLSGITKLVSLGPASLPTPATLTLPFDLAEYERYEGMSVVVDQPLTVTGVYALGEYGEVELSANGRLYAPTQIVNPGAEAVDRQALNDRLRIQLDDGSSAANRRPIPFLNSENTLRLGSTLTSLSGVLDFSFGRYEIKPTAVLAFTDDNPRMTTPVSVNALLRVACLNVDNFFNGDGSGGGFPTARGATTYAEYQRQRQKLISAIAAIDAEILGLVEMENDGFGANSAIQDLVDGLNAAMGANTFAVINPGLDRVGTDEITNVILYKPAAVEPVGAPAILDHAVNPLFDEFSRPSLAQTFADGEGDRFTFVVNHFRSKGGTCSGDPDIGDGQGACNQTRTHSALALRDWLATDPTGSGDPDYLIMGDLNAYLQEDPICVFTAAGYVHEISRFLGVQAYTYVFDNQSGCLDHALASPPLDAQITGATLWHINADEPDELDYRSVNPPELYASGPFRSSDHDPVIVGLNLEPPIPIDLTLLEARWYDGVVVLRWQTASEADLAGFNLWRSFQRDGEYVKINTTLVKNQGDSISGASYEYRDAGGKAIGFYKLELVSMDGRTRIYGPVAVSAPTPVSGENLPTAFALSINFPNPCNPSTTIVFQAPRDGRITLTVYNIAGQAVTELINDHYAPGEYCVRWDGRDRSGAAVPSGVYFYRLESNGVNLTQKMLLVR